MRADDGTWNLRVLGPGDVLSFTAPDFKLSVDDLYAGAFDAAAP